MESGNHLHVPVMVNEVEQLLKPERADEDIFLIDCTLGEGGHSDRFLSSYPRIRVLGIDRDAAIQARARKRLGSYGSRVEFFLGWFDDFFDSADRWPRPDRVLFDLGISVFHYAQSGRGFSFLRDESLDMRLNSDADTSAEDIVNSMSENDLSRIFFEYGEERYAKRIAAAIVTERRKQRILTARQLAEIVFVSVPVSYRHGRIHPATRVFQALRIAVNRELERIESAVVGAFRVLKPGGLLAVISFHSLEDRIVKNLFREWNKACICPPEQPMCKCGGNPLGSVLTKKPMLPSDEEIRANSPSRSAKLRAIRKLRDRRDDA